MEVRRGLRRSALLATVLLVPALLGLPSQAAGAAPAAPAAPGATTIAPGSAHRQVVTQRSRALKLLAQVNQARSRGRTCGSTYYPAAKALKYRSSLATAARRHARDMARNDYFDHYSRTGSSPTGRARSAGYHGGVGENIAAGYGGVTRTMNAWLASPGHCANIMSRSYRHLGIGYAYDASSSYRDYWVQDFGTG